MTQHTHAQKGELPHATTEPSAPWTPAPHAQVNKTKPARLQDLTDPSPRIEYLCSCGVKTTRVMTSAPCTCNGCGAIWHSSEGPARTADHFAKNGEKSQPWTPAHHAQVNKTKPIRLLELGEGEHGKNARFEFPEGWQRTIDLPTQADGWHPIFSDLPGEDTQALRRHVEQPVTIRPDGRRTQSLGLSFTTAVPTRRNYLKDFNLFDVPEEVYEQGRITGYRCAAELLEALQRGYGPHIDVRGTIREASRALSDGYGKPSRVGAAGAFMAVVEEALKFLARHAQHGDFIARRIKDAECAQTWLAEQEAKEKAAFVERMRQARAAKRAAKAEGGRHG